MVDADLKGYFDGIPHDRLMALLSLIERFLKQDIMDETARWTPASDIPQGAVLSPLLAKLYLHPLDLLVEVEGHHTVRYADDFVILCRTAAEADAVLTRVKTWLAANGLTLHPTKTHVGDCMQPGQGFELLGYRFAAGQRRVPEEPGRVEGSGEPARSVAGATASAGSLRISIRSCAAGSSNFNTPNRPWGCSGGSTRGAGAGCVRSCASRVTGLAWDVRRPIT